MQTLNNGEIIGVPCAMQSGPFAHERFICVDAEDGPLMGFADQVNLQSSDGKRGFIKAVVLDASSDAVKVRLFGSFFRTAVGLAYVRRTGLAKIVSR